MHSRQALSKQKDDDDAYSTISKNASHKATKHLDYKLKEQELILIRSKLPQGFLLLDPKGPEI